MGEGRKGGGVGYSLLPEVVQTGGGGITSLFQPTLLFRPERDTFEHESSRLGKLANPGWFLGKLNVWPL